MDEHDVTLGDHRLCLGDCHEVLPFLQSGSVGLVIADLPYGVTSAPYDVGADGRPMDAKKAHKKRYAIDMQRLWPLLWRVCASNAACMMFCAQPFTSHLVYSCPKHFKYEIIWHKVRPSRWLHAKNMPLSCHETILVFYKNKPPYSPQMIVRDAPHEYDMGNDKKNYSINYGGNSNEARRALGRKRYTHRHPTTVLSYARPSRGIHPTQKPIELLQWIIKSYCPPGQIVLDPTSGVASTAIAAARTGRRSICIERDPDYYAKGVQRIRDELTGVVPQPKPKRPRKPPPAAQRALWSAD